MSKDEKKPKPYSDRRFNFYAMCPVDRYATFMYEHRCKFDAGPWPTAEQAEADLRVHLLTHAPGTVRVSWE